ncbi:beta-galactosidase [Haloferula helveola]|uniref:Beta-galactosidase n=1 Tax=Haloferula helveola TaxID=490095 RepID=A0ABN6H7P7_9BACT|nr:beta-galactosidase [Haloferula helveola]
MKLHRLLLSLLGTLCAHAGILDLSGEWRFALDPKDHGLGAGPDTWRFPDTIELPGTTAGQGKGPELEVELRMDKETMNRLRERHPYVGPAWYQRDVTIPDDWKGSDIRLTLERVLWESRVWIDGKPVGEPQNSLSVPHRYSLTDHLRPGETHTLTLRIDNRQIVDIGTIGHAYTAGTQTIWNGVIGDIQLEAIPKRRLDHVEIRTTPGRPEVKFAFEITNRSTPINGTIEVRLAAPDQPERLLGRRPYRLPKGTFVQELFLPDRPDGLSDWSEFNPEIHRLTVSLEAGGERHVFERNIGFREFVADGRHLRINGEMTFLRGNLECAIFPQTGHPDAEGPQWEKIMRTSRDYGLNHLRFHSWCPPEAAFEAADRHGIYLQVELPNWTFKMGQRPEVDAFFIAEGERILREFGHHPSFVMFALGNELVGDLAAMDRMVEHFRKLAPDVLFTSTSFAFSPRGKLPGPADDFFISQQTQSGWVRGQGFLNSTFPSTDTDYAEGLECLSIPLVTHEVGQYVVYPNLAELPKYESTPLRSTALEVIRKDLQSKHMLDDAHRLTRDSGKLAALLYKEDIERALRTKDLAGIQLLQLQDFPGQSTATVGLLDSFWDSKGLIEPERFRDFCSPAVPLARMRKFVWENTETFAAEIELANFTGSTLKTGFTATLLEPDGETLAQATFPSGPYPQGNSLEIGRFETGLTSVDSATRLTLVVESGNKTLRNSWPIWVYPSEEDTPDAIVHHGASEACLKDLEAGKTVLLLPKGNAIRSPIDARFIPVFWSPLHFPDQPGTLGATIDTDHPLWSDFPTDTHTNWQWWELTAQSSAVDLAGSVREIGMPFRFIDKYDRNALPAAIFEAKVGEGKLLVCTLDVTSRPGERIVARQLFRALRKYAASPQFDPTGALQPEKLRELFRPAGVIATASSAHPGFPATQAIDGDAATIWHSDWREASAKFPITYTLDLVEPAELVGVRVQNRTDKTNGRVREFAIDASSDGETWSPVLTSATLADSGEAKDFVFRKPIEARALRFRALSSHTGKPMASLAEFAPIRSDSADVRDLGIIPGFND